MNSTVSAGCPTLVTITPSNGTFEAGDELTCSANGYNPTYTWTGTAGVNGAIVSETGDIYSLAKGPFNVTCTAKVSQLPTPCQASAIVSNNAYSKHKKQHISSNIIQDINLIIIHNVLLYNSIQEQEIIFSAHTLYINQLVYMQLIRQI